MKTLSPENLEKLFLFEVYVETLRIDYPKLCLTQNCLNTLKETIIQFQFLGFQPMEIREDEFIEEQENCCDRVVKAGKSCLFSLRDLPREVRCLEVDVKVLRMTERNCSIPLAVTSIKLGEQFANIFKSNKLKKHSTSLKKPFTLYDRRCREVGKITVNLTLSCFGKIITTSFQMDGEDSKAYVVQPGGEVPIADFLKSESSFDKGLCPFRNSMTMMSPSYPAMVRPAGGQRGGFGPQPAMQAFPISYPGQWPAQGGPFGGIQGGLMGGFQGGPMGGPQRVFMGGYQGGLMGGAQVGLMGGPQRVFMGGSQGGLLGGAQVGLMGGFRGEPQSGLMGGAQFQAPSRGKEPSESSSSEECPPPPPFQICSCDYPLPQGFFAPAPKKKKKKKKKKDACPLGMMRDFCMNPICPKGYPQLPIVEERQQVCQAMEVPTGVFGMKGEQMVFQLPLDNQPVPGNRRARFSLGGGAQGNLKDVRIMSDGETKKFTVPNKLNDIYVIKVGKINQETDLRQKMVLEVKQPRPPTDDRIFDDIRTQYLETDFMTEQPKKEKKKKGKGKKGKGKGKKKGKK